MMNKTKIVDVLYHDNCCDGMMSALVMKRVLDTAPGMEGRFRAVNYGGEPPEASEGSDITYILDFSYSKEQLLSMLDIGHRNITVMDHHEKAAQMLGGWGVQSEKVRAGDKDVHLTTILNNEYSGAGLVFNHFGRYIKYDNTAEKTRLAFLTAAVQDRDLWRFEMPDTRFVHQSLRDIPFTLEAWEAVLKESPEEFKARLERGKDRRLQMDQENAEIASKAVLKTVFGHVVPVVECDAWRSSDIGDILDKQHPFALMYHRIKDGESVQCSLRSDVKHGVNVNVLSQQFGGGGHPNAAGFRVPVSVFNELMGNT